jgi:hypothetical protein
MQRCDEHGTEFRVGHVCPNPACKHPGAGTPQPSEGELLAAEAKRRAMPEVLDHEQQFALRAVAEEKHADYLRKLSKDLLTLEKRTDAQLEQALQIERCAGHAVERGRKLRREAADLATIRESKSGDEQLVTAAARVKAEAN